MKKLINLCLLVLCGLSVFAQIQVKISGTIANATEKSILLARIESFEGGKIKEFDEIKIQNGKFQKNVSLPEVGLCLLKVGEKSIVLMLEGNENINLKIDFKKMPFYEVSGSQGSELVRAYILENDKMNQEKIKPLEEKFKKASSNEEKEQIIANFMNVQNEIKKKMNSWALEKFGSSIALFMLTLEWNDDTDLAYIDEINKRFQAKFKGTQVANYVDNLADNYKKFAIGSIAPDIELPTPEGKNIKLSSLRGKYVLLDFWAAWCTPCRAENPSVVKAYEKFKSKGFDIYGVSLDEDKDKWTKAIIKDGLNWTNVSDLQGWDSIVARAYGVTAIPKNFLLDKEGRIIAKNLRGSALEAKLKELMP